VSERISTEARSRIMRSIRGRDTGPERAVRSIVHSLGFRFRLHRKDLPGTPDLVLPRHRTVILVHGCFWHAHRCRAGRVEPRSNAAFWRAKRLANRTRDARVRAALRARGWTVIEIWECQLKDPEAVARKICAALREPAAINSRPVGPAPAARLPAEVRGARRS
jgi:DNA mismatch endonuclease (patch repair protein)